jgi:hypothetical protein
MAKNKKRCMLPKYGGGGKPKAPKPYVANDLNDFAYRQQAYSDSLSTHNYGMLRAQAYERDNPGETWPKKVPPAPMQEVLPPRINTQPVRAPHQQINKIPSRQPQAEYNQSMSYQQVPQMPYDSFGEAVLHSNHNYAKNTNQPIGYWNTPGIKEPMYTREQLEAMKTNKKVQKFSNGGFGSKAGFNTKLQDPNIASSSFNHIYGDGTAQVPGSEGLNYDPNQMQSTIGGESVSTDLVSMGTQAAGMLGGGMPYAAIGNMAGQMIRTKPGERPNSTQNMLAGGAQGAGMGMQVAGPIGAIVGGVAGMAYEGITHGKKSKAFEKGMMDNYTNKQNSEIPQSIFAMGGELNQFHGPSHEEGGITLGGDQPFAEVEGQETSAKLPDESGEEGQYIYSDRLKPKGSKRTFAQLSKSIENKYKRRSGDKLAEASKMRDLEGLKAQQEQVRESMVANTYKKAYGGDLPKYNFGDWLAKPSTQTGIYDAAGSILPQIGPQTYMNKTMGKQRQMVNSLQPTQLSSNLVSDRESQEAIRDGYNTGEYNLRQVSPNSGSYLAGMSSLAGKRMRESAGAHERVNNMNSQIKNQTQAQQAQLNTQYDFTKAGMNFGIDRDYHAALSESTGYASRALKAPQDRRNEKLSLMAKVSTITDPSLQKEMMELIKQQYGG